MSSASHQFDLIVIGGGPAGVVGANVGALAGKNVALVEARPELGGAGVNTGTVPSKTLRETALAISGMRSRKLYGVDLSLRREATIADLLRHEQNVKSAFSAAIAQRLAGRQVTTYRGDASFIDSHTLRVASAASPQPRDTVLSGENILIATGSSPLRPELFPFGAPGVHDSDTILQLQQLPKSIAVIGAGVIGSEYACTFAAIGTETHLIDGREVLLPFLDAELSRGLADAMVRNGINFHWKERVRSCAVGDSGGISLTMSSGAVLNVEAVLVAAGRKSNTDALNLSAAGVVAGERGLLQVDEHFRTNVAHIYAAGDVIGFPALASTSMEQARRAVSHALDPLRPGAPLPLLPTGIYTIPEASMTGETEESLRKKGIEYVVGRAAYRDNARGRIIGDEDGFLKLLFRRGDMKLLGVHVMGEQATEVVHIGLIAMLAGAGASLLNETCFNVPTLGALYKYAAIDAIHGISGGGGADNGAAVSATIAVGRSISRARGASDS